MSQTGDHEIIDRYLQNLGSKDFPCVAAREAVAQNHVKCFVASHLACPADDSSILHFLYDFIDQYRETKDLFYSAAIIFRQPVILDEMMFDSLMWQRLQSLADLDAQNYKFDQRVSSDPASNKFSFSLKGEAFFIIGIHPQSSRASRKFEYPVLAFNPHAQFETMRSTGQYDKFKNIVRKRELSYSGSINPMLDDFGKSSEVYQYSGLKYDHEWKCPLIINHESTNNNSSPDGSGLPVEERSTS